MSRWHRRQPVVPERNENRSRGRGAEQFREVTGEHGIISNAEAGLILPGAAFPRNLEARQRGSRLLQPLGPQPDHASSIRLEERRIDDGAVKRSDKPDMMLGSAPQWSDRDGTPRGRDDRKPQLSPLVGEDCQKLVAAADGAVADHSLDLLMIEAPDVGRGKASSACCLGCLLQLPVRQDQVAGPARIIRICPREAQVQGILERCPDFCASAPRRMRVDAAEGASRGQHATGDRDVHLQPSGMCVRGGVSRRSAAVWDSGQRHREEEAQGDIDLPAQRGISGVEGLDVDVVTRERQHRRTISVDEAEAADRRAQQISPPQQDLRQGIASHEEAPSAGRALHDNGRVHVGRQGSTDVRSVPGARMLRERDQHSQETASAAEDRVGSVSAASTRRSSRAMRSASIGSARCLTSAAIS
ncbi:hypothetical protein [Paracoccus sp. S-4012]|uniref:hypothetical protein n=1 Tax=Paracoccus sp. S-4012 TaxID=2665648 RepID=UPI001E4D2113|nr:hypothetical protein [Paracoccus sp. S-4012]